MHFALFSFWSLHVGVVATVVIRSMRGVVIERFNGLIANCRCLMVSPTVIRPIMCAIVSWLFANGVQLLRFGLCLCWLPNRLVYNFSLTRSGCVCFRFMRIFGNLCDNCLFIISPNRLWDVLLPHCLSISRCWWLRSLNSAIGKHSVCCTNSSRASGNCLMSDTAFTSMALVLASVSYHLSSFQ